MRVNEDVSAFFAEKKAERHKFKSKNCDLDMNQGGQEQYLDTKEENQTDNME